MMVMDGRDRIDISTGSGIVGTTIANFLESADSPQSHGASSSRPRPMILQTVRQMIEHNNRRGQSVPSDVNREVNNDGNNDDDEMLSDEYWA